MQYLTLIILVLYLLWHFRGYIEQLLPGARKRRAKKKYNGKDIIDGVNYEVEDDDKDE